jgi:hypothetical protein
MSASACRNPYNKSERHSPSYCQQPARHSHRLRRQTDSSKLLWWVHCNTHSFLYFPLQTPKGTEQAQLTLYPLNQFWVALMHPTQPPLLPFRGKGDLTTRLQAPPTQSRSGPGGSQREPPGSRVQPAVAACGLGMPIGSRTEQREACVCACVRLCTLGPGRSLTVGRGGDGGRVLGAAYFAGVRVADVLTCHSEPRNPLPPPCSCGPTSSPARSNGGPKVKIIGGKARQLKIRTEQNRNRIEIQETGNAYGNGRRIRFLGTEICLGASVLSGFMRATHPRVYTVKMHRGEVGLRGADIGVARYGGKRAGGGPGLGTSHMGTQTRTYGARRLRIPPDSNQCPECPAYSPSLS